MITPAQTAIHESGHVVVGHALDLACNGVALTHDEADCTDTLGYVDTPNPVFGYEGCSAKERQQTMRAESIACCAGLAAEHVFFGVPLSTDNENAQHDFQNIIDMERHHGLRTGGKRGGFVGDETTWRYIARCLTTAKKLVQRHRDAIQRMADILVVKKRLTTDDVAHILDPQ
jgi:ATP-dependent Zn protease